MTLMQVAAWGLFAATIGWLVFERQVSKRERSDREGRGE